MATAKQSATRRPKMAERAQQLRELMFPGWQDLLWDRKTNDGFITIPRVLPIVMQIIDEQRKGVPAGHTYLGLWARSPDHALVTVDNQHTFATEAGFQGGRAVDTWRRRMKLLRDLGFIITRRGASGEFHHVLLVNPVVSVEVLRNRKLVRDEPYFRLVERLAEIGAAVGRERAAELMTRAKEHAASVAAGTTEGPVHPAAAFLNEGPS